MPPTGGLGHRHRPRGDAARRRDHHQGGHPLPDPAPRGVLTLRPLRRHPPLRFGWLLLASLGNASGHLAVRSAVHWPDAPGSDRPDGNCVQNAPGMARSRTVRRPTGRPPSGVGGQEAERSTVVQGPHGAEVPVVHRGDVQRLVPIGERDQGGIGQPEVELRPPLGDLGDLCGRAGPPVDEVRLGRDVGPEAGLGPASESVTDQVVDLGEDEAVSSPAPDGRARYHATTSAWRASRRSASVYVTDVSRTITARRSRRGTGRRCRRRHPGPRRRRWP